LQGEFVEHRQEMESLLWLECKQVQIHQKKANHLSKAFYEDTWAESSNGKQTKHFSKDIWRNEGFVRAIYVMAM
jgi:hypothetical protein